MKLGLVTTGQGPRAAYEDYFRGLGRALGLTFQVESAHILDALDWDQIRPHLAQGDTSVLGAHVHVPGATGNRLGPGWDHVYVDLNWAMDYFQQAINRLQARGAGVIALCCGTEFAPDAFHAEVPLIAPCDLTLRAVASAVAARGKLRLGVMSSIGHAAQDVALWRRQSFADRLALDYEGFEGDLMPAAERLAAKGRHDMVVVWSFGLGAAESDVDRMAARLEDMLGCPVLMPHRLAAMQALALAPLGFDDKAMVARGR